MTDTPPTLEESKNEASPLWLPDGSIRAIIALVLVGVLSYLAVIGIVEADRIVEILLVVIGFYFGSKRA